MTADLGIARWIERRAGLAPDAPALVHGSAVRTYAETASRVRRVASALRARRVAPGDRVVWLGDNHPAFLELLFATARIGAVLAPVNHHLDDGVARSLIDAYAPRAVVLGRGARTSAVPANVRLRIDVDGGPGADTGFEDLAAAGCDEAIPVEVDPSDVCLMPHTSGTTGRPKGVMLTHGNVTWNAVNLLSVVDIRTGDVTLAVAPFFRSGGTGVNVLPVLFKGGTVVVPEGNDAGELLRLIERHRVTVGFGNPDVLDALVTHPRWAATRLDSVRLFVTGGAPVPERLIRAYGERRVTLVQGYGLSEAAPTVSILDPCRALVKAGAAGRPPMYVDIRVVTAEGRDAAAGETGELLVRGPNVMAGYWRDPDATRRAVDEHGWLHTGDAARMDADGDLWIVGRVADAYESGGHRVFPGDVERALMTVPGVVDAAVASGDRSATALVVLAAPGATTAAELLRVCRRHLPSHAVPGAVRVVDRLPRSSVGKLLRDDLAALLETERRRA